MSSEDTPLIPSSSGGNNTSYYFLHQTSETDQSIDATSQRSTRDADGGEVLEMLPPGTKKAKFAARPVGSSPRHFRNKKASKQARGNFLQKLFGFGTNEPKGSGVGTMVKKRTPLKVDPKVYFANERTFLAWLHTSILLAGSSIAIGAFAQDRNPWSQIYGILLLPIAIAFICYAMFQYSKRCYMIRARHPGPWGATIAPTVLGVMLMLSILAHFAIKLYKS